MHNMHKSHTTRGIDINMEKPPRWKEKPQASKKLLLSKIVNSGITNISLQNPLANEEIKLGLYISLL